MANNSGFHCRIKPIQSSKNHSVVAKSAYNNGLKMVDYSTGKVHDYRSKRREKMIRVTENGIDDIQVFEQNLVESMIILPKKAEGIEFTRELYWNEIMQIETRKKAQLGSEIDVMFPLGLDKDMRFEVVKEYSQFLADRYNVLIDTAIHNPHAHTKIEDGKTFAYVSENHHAHILISPREIIKNGRSYKHSNRKHWGLWSTRDRLKAGLNGRTDETKFIREQWAEICNRRLPKDLHISSKSHRENNINKIPTLRLGKGLYTRKLKGERSIIDEYNLLVKKINKKIEDENLIIQYPAEEERKTKVVEIGGTKVVYHTRTKNKIIRIDTLKFVKNTAYDVDVLTDFMTLAKGLSDDKELKRNLLFGRVHSENEICNAHLKTEIELFNSFERLQKKIEAVDGNNMLERSQRELKELFGELTTRNDLKTLEGNLMLLDSFAEDETKQTGLLIQRVEGGLSEIEKRNRGHEACCEKIASCLSEFSIGVDLSLELHSDRKVIDNLEVKLRNIDESVSEKLDYVAGSEVAMTGLFEKLQSIGVAVNRGSLLKYIDKSDIFNEKIQLLQCKKEYKLLHEYDVDSDIYQSVLDKYKALDESIDEDYKAIKKYIHSMMTSFDKLEPLYQEKLDVLAKVKESNLFDNEFIEEIEQTATSYALPKKILVWESAFNDEILRVEQARIEQEKQATIEHERKLLEESRSVKDVEPPVAEKPKYKPRRP